MNTYLFSCDEASLAVLMYSVCLSVRDQVEMLICMKVPGCSRRFKEGSGKVQGRFRDGSLIFFIFYIISSEKLTRTSQCLFLHIFYS